MKSKSKLCRVMFCLSVIAASAYGQGFVNLGFESANVSTLPPGQGEFVSSTNAFPGWQVYLGGRLATMSLHNTVPLGSVNSAIFGPNYLAPSQIIEGNFTAVLFPGIDLQFGPTNVSLAQSGFVPSDALSIRFKAIVDVENSLGVFLNGQFLPLFPLQTEANYTLYGANVGAFAGQVSDLHFTTSYNGPGRSASLDGIFFSPVAVPEPGTWALLGLGSALLWSATRCRRK